MAEGYGGRHLVCFIGQHLSNNCNFQSRRDRRMASSFVCEGLKKPRLSIAPSFGWASFSLSLGFLCRSFGAPQQMRLTNCFCLKLSPTQLNQIASRNDTE